MNLFAFTRALAPEEKKSIYMIWINADHVESVIEQSGHAVIHMNSGQAFGVQESMEEVVDTLVNGCAE